MAIDSPMLSAILSIMSIDFLFGNNAKIRMYPGINSMNGRPNIIRSVSSILSKTSGIRIKLHIMQMIMSTGYFLYVIFIFYKDF